MTLQTFASDVVVTGRRISASVMRRQHVHGLLFREPIACGLPTPSGTSGVTDISQRACRVEQTSVVLSIPHRWVQVLSTLWFLSYILSEQAIWYLQNIVEGNIYWGGSTGLKSI